MTSEDFFSESVICTMHNLELNIQIPPANETARTGNDESPRYWFRSPVEVVRFSSALCVRQDFQQLSEPELSMGKGST